MSTILTVRDLIAILSTFDGDLPVAMGMNMEYYAPVTADMVGLSGSEVVIDDCFGV
jgi:hypothetical protein